MVSSQLHQAEAEIAEEVEALRAVLGSD